MSLKSIVLGVTTLPLKVGALVTAFAIFLAWERIWPAAPRPQAPSLGATARLAGNLTLGVSVIVVYLLVALPATVIGSAHATRGFFDWRGAWAGGPLGFAIDFLLLDLFAYLWHRAVHELEFLWRLHEIHHRDEFLDSTTGVRFHPLEIALGGLLRGCLVFGAAMPLEHVLLFDAILLLMAWFSHSNIRMPARLEAALGWVIVTPEMHWTHHRTTKPETDQNYGAVLCLWDRLFRTRARRKRRLGMELGVKSEPDLPLGALLVEPFRNRRDD